MHPKSIEKTMMNIHEENQIDITNSPEAIATTGDEPEVIVEVETADEVPEERKGRRASLMAAVRERAYNADLTKAHLALMEREVILPHKQLELFRLVNRHYRQLQNWHDRYTGWRVQRGTAVIRLVRYLSTTSTGYLYERLKEPKDFACLTWALWYAENRQLSGRGNDQQFLLSQLAEQIQEQSNLAADSEKQFDFRKQADRYNIQRALQYLEDVGGIHLVDGQTREWVEQTPDADVLYEFTDVIRSLVTALNPEILASVSERINDPAIRLQPALLPGVATIAPDLVRAWRTLLLGPALFRFDDPAAFAALKAHADEIANELIETFGWLLDVHLDYACIVRASGTATGPVTGLNLVGASDQIAMLLCGAIRKQVEAGAWPAPDEYGCIHVTTGDIEELFYSVRERYGENWGNEARGKSSRSLINDVYKKMRQAGLLRGPDDAGNVLILPTAARYAVSYDAGEEATTARNRSKRAAKDNQNTISIWPET